MQFCPQVNLLLVLFHISGVRKKVAYFSAFPGRLLLSQTPLSAVSCRLQTLPPSFLLSRSPSEPVFTSSTHLLCRLPPSLVCVCRYPSRYLCTLTLSSLPAQWLQQLVAWVAAAIVDFYIRPAIRKFNEVGWKEERASRKRQQTTERSSIYQNILPVLDCQHARSYVCVCLCAERNPFFKENTWKTAKLDISKSFHFNTFFER